MNTMNSKIKISLVTLFLNFVCIGLFAQVPLVYNKENTGAALKPPVLPTITDHIITTSSVQVPERNVGSYTWVMDIS